VAAPPGSVCWEEQGGHCHHLQAAKDVAQRLVDGGVYSVYRMIEFVQVPRQKKKKEEISTSIDMHDIVSPNAWVFGCMCLNERIGAQPSHIRPV
jgi:hypothetical protein